MSPKKRGRGRPEHEPTEKTRSTVKLLSGFGIPHPQIADEIGVSEPTLHKYYQTDIDKGLRQANARVAGSLFQKAVGNGPAAVTAAIYWTKARMNWKDTTAVEHTGKDGTALPPVMLYLPHNGRDDPEKT